MVTAVCNVFAWPERRKAGVAEAHAGHSGTPTPRTAPGTAVSADLRGAAA